MIVIDGKIVDEQILKKEFVCDLQKCKGACCVEGDSGAPLEDDEVDILESIYENIKPFLTAEGIEAIEAEGHFVFDEEERRCKTTLIKGGPCAYIQYENGVSQCGIERAWKAGATDFRKPISCHLYPIRIDTQHNTVKLKYEKWSICADACTLGKSLKVPVYKFLKEPIIRKYGEQFYAGLTYVAEKG
jgi:hypothetical protein